MIDHRHSSHGAQHLNQLTLAVRELLKRLPSLPQLKNSKEL